MMKHYIFQKSLILLCAIFIVNGYDSTTKKKVQESVSAPDVYVLQEGDCDFITIIVPEYPKRPHLEKQFQDSLKNFALHIEIPQDFFEKSVPQKSTKPLLCYFDWQEEESSKTRKNAAITLAKSLELLRKKYKKSTFVVIGMGQGGNVIQGATQKITAPIDMVIQLATPLYDQSKKNDKQAHFYSDFILNDKMVKQLFTFYTEKDFSLLHPALHPRYMHYHENSGHPLLSNILLLINNKHPLPADMMNNTVGKRLFALCKKIKQTYKHHNHLIAHISTVKPEADLVVVLRSTNVYPGVEHDSKKVSQERVLSTVYSQRFKKNWGRALTASPSFRGNNHIDFKGFKSFLNSSLC